MIFYNLLQWFEFLYFSEYSNYPFPCYQMFRLGSGRSPENIKFYSLPVLVYVEKANTQLVLEGRRALALMTSLEF